MLRRVAVGTGGGVGTRWFCSGKRKVQTVGFANSNIENIK